MAMDLDHTRGIETTGQAMVLASADGMVLVQARLHASAHVLQRMVLAKGLDRMRDIGKTGPEILLVNADDTVMEVQETLLCKNLDDAQAARETEPSSSGIVA